MKMDEIIVNVPEKDISSVVQIHQRAFNGFFLTDLGSNFLKLYYKSVAKNERGVLLGYYKDSQLIGFCAATTLSQGFNKKLVSDNITSFSLIAIRLLFAKPRALIRLLKNFTKSNPSINDKGLYAELLSIGVSPKAQGIGVGKSLLFRLEKKLSEKGCKELSLTTDYYKNEKAIGFYNSLGYETMYDFIAYPQRKMYRLIKKLI